MAWFRFMSAIALASQLAWGADTPGSKSPPAVDANGRAPSVGTAIPPVLRPSEPPDTRVVVLPGAATQHSAPSKKPAIAAPRKPFVPTPAPSVPAKAPTVSEPLPLPPATPAAAPATAPVPPVRKSFVLKPAPSVPAKPPVIPELPPPPADPAIPAATAPASPVRSQPRADAEASKPAFPDDFARESALYCQKQIGQWTEGEARALLGDPLRDRPAYDDNQLENGRIYAFSDPSGRYREMELDFAQSGGLRAVFVYPWQMTWQECRRLWGANVRSTEANRGRTFYSYTNRRLDVLVDPDGKVVSLGLY